MNDLDSQQPKKQTDSESESYRQIIKLGGDWGGGNIFDFFIKSKITDLTLFLHTFVNIYIRILSITEERYSVLYVHTRSGF